MVTDDLRKVRDALIVLSGHLPLFVSEPRKAERARAHLGLRQDAFVALDRICDALDEPRLQRVVGK